MGLVENMNKELCGLVRCFRIYLREKAKVEITTESPLLPWLVRHCGWILCRYAVRADGRTGYSRLKGREFSAGVAIFGEAIWYKLPKAADLTKLDDRWRTAIWLGKSDRSDEHIIGVDTGAVLARSVRRKAEGKRWHERALKMVTGTPWNPRPGEVVTRRRYITRALVERYGSTEDCRACFRRSQQHSERCRARFELLCAGEDGPVEVRAQEGMQAPSDPAAPNLVSTSTAAQAGKVDTDAMETEENKPAVSSQAPAIATPVEPSVAGTVAGLSVYSLLTPVNEISIDEIPVNYVATHEIDHRPVYDHKTGERLPPHLVKVGRQTKHDAMIRHQLFERVPITKARGKKVRCQWLDEMKEGVKGSFVRSRLVAMEVAHGARFDTFAGTAPLKCIKIIISRAASIKNVRGQHTRVLALFDISVAFWHALLPEDEPIAMYPPRGEEEAGYMWQMKRAMYGTRRASRLFQEHMKGVLKEAGYAALRVCQQVYHCLEVDSMAAIHGDDIIAEGEPKDLDRLDEVLKKLVVVKVLDRVGPGAAELGQYLKRHIAYIVGKGYEWLENPKHIAAIIKKNLSNMGAKPQSSLDSKDLGETNPEALEQLEEMEAHLYQQNTGINIYMSNGRFDIQFCVKRLSEMMTKPRKMGNLWLARLARYLVGTQMLTLRFDHQEYGDTQTRLAARNATPHTQGWNSMEDTSWIRGLHQIKCGR